MPSHDVKHKEDDVVYSQDELSSNKLVEEIEGCDIGGQVFEHSELHSTPGIFPGCKLCSAHEAHCEDCKQSR